MSATAGRSKPSGSKTPTQTEQVAAEKDRLLRSMKRHGQILVSDDPNAKLGPGQTAVYVEGEGGTGLLVRRRKSLIGR